MSARAKHRRSNSATQRRTKIIRRRHAIFVKCICIYVIHPSHHNKNKSWIPWDFLNPTHMATYRFGSRRLPFERASIPVLQRKTTTVRPACRAARAQNLPTTYYGLVDGGGNFWSHPVANVELASSRIWRGWVVRMVAHPMSTLSAVGNWWAVKRWSTLFSASSSIVRIKHSKTRKKTPGIHRWRTCTCACVTWNRTIEGMGKYCTACDFDFENNGYTVLRNVSWLRCGPL